MMNLKYKSQIQIYSRDSFFFKRISLNVLPIFFFMVIL